MFHGGVLQRSMSNALSRLQKPKMFGYCKPRKKTGETSNISSIYAPGSKAFFSKKNNIVELLLDEIFNLELSYFLSLFYVCRHSFASEGNKLLMELQHHKKACRAVAFSSDGSCKCNYKYGCLQILLCGIVVLYM